MLKLFNLYRQIARQFSLENAIYESRERYGMHFSISLSSAKSLFIGSISMSVILRFSRQHFLSRPCEWKDRLEIPWPIFRLVSSRLYSICFLEESHTRTRIAKFDFLTRIFLFIDFASYVLGTVVLKRKEEALFTSSGRGETLKSH